MGRVIISGDTKVIDKKGNTRFFSDTLINNAQFMKDGGWEIFDSPDVPAAPTFEMDDEAAKKAKEEADAIAAAASSTEKNLADAGTVANVKSIDDMTKNEIIVLLDDYNETAEAKIDFKASESKEILYNKYIATNQK